MKLKQVNQNGNRLKILLQGDIYAIDLYQDFESVKDLKIFVADEFGKYYKTRFSYFY